MTHFCHYLPIYLFIYLFICLFIILSCRNQLKNPCKVVTVVSASVTNVLSKGGGIIYGPLINKYYSIFFYFQVC